MSVFFDGIEWDEHNLDQACRRLTAAATVIARYDTGRHLVRPITAWEEEA